VHEDLKSLIGLFANVLVLRTDASDDPHFAQLLRRNRETILGAFEHQLLPYAMLLPAVASHGSRGEGPLYRIVFILQAPETFTSERATMKTKSI
jgi:non-ribosomal peptide synthetase component F